MSSTVVAGDFTVTSSYESADSMVEALTPQEEAPDTPQVIKDGGKTVEADDPKEGLSKAASELGKAGAKAAKAARKEAAKTETAEAEEKEPEKPRDTRGNPRHDPKARVEQATREAKEAKERALRHEQENRELRARVERLERGGGERLDGPPARTPEPTAAPQEPRSEDYETYEEYVKAVARHEYRVASEEGARQAYAHYQAQQHVQKLNGVVEGYRTAYEKASTEEPGFADSVRHITDRLVPSFTLPNDAPRGPMNWLADDLLSYGESAPALLRYFRDNEAEIQRFAALSMPRAVTRELAKIEDRLTAATTGPSVERGVSKAPPPVTPVTGTPSIANNGAPRNGEDDDAWFRRNGVKPPKR